MRLDSHFVASRVVRKIAMSGVKSKLNKTWFQGPSSLSPIAYETGKEMNYLTIRSHSAVRVYSHNAHLCFCLLSSTQTAGLIKMRVLKRLLFKCQPQREIVSWACSIWPRPHSCHRWAHLRCSLMVPPWSSNSRGQELRWPGRQGVLRHFRFEHRWQFRTQLPRTTCDRRPRRLTGIKKIERGSEYFISLFITITRDNKPRPGRISTAPGARSIAVSSIACWNIWSFVIDALSSPML